MKLGLGTVQFGLDYGATNRAGRTSRQDVRTILIHAAASGVDLLDTAALYGDAESVLGDTLPRPHGFRIVTKTVPLDPALPVATAVANVRQGVLASLGRLREERIAGLLVHRPDDLLGPSGDELFAAIAGLRDAGLVGKVGVSVYTPDEAERILSRHAIDLIQLPLNPLDQRTLQRGTLAKLAGRGVEIHVRSAFLQGVLLSPPGQVPARLAALAPALAAWRQLVAELGLSPLAAALGFLKGCPEIAAIVCGATSPAEFDEIAAAFAAAPALPQEAFKNLRGLDDKLIDPRLWPPT